MNRENLVDLLSTLGNSEDEACPKLRNLTSLLTRWDDRFQLKLDSLMENLQNSRAFMLLNVSVALADVIDGFQNTTISFQEALSILADIHGTVKWIYEIYEGYHLRYGMLIALVLLSILVFNEICKILVSMCMFLGKEYHVCREFLQYRTHKQTRRRQSLQGTSEENRPAIAMPMYCYQ